MELNNSPSATELDRIMNALRDQLASTGQHSLDGAHTAPPMAKQRGDSSIEPTIDPVDRGKLEYELADITAAEDDNFVRHAYRCLLKREPDPTGEADFTAQLSSGQRNRADVALAIAQSPECRSIGVKLRVPFLSGLRWRLQGIPFIGSVVKFGVGMLLSAASQQDQRIDHYEVLRQRKSLLRIASVVGLQGAESLETNYPLVETTKQLARENARLTDRMELLFRYLNYQKLDRSSADAVPEPKAVVPDQSLPRRAIARALRRKVDRGEVRALVVSKADAADVALLASRLDDLVDEVQNLRSELKDNQSLQQSMMAQLQAITSSIDGLFAKIAETRAEILSEDEARFQAMLGKHEMTAVVNSLRANVASQEQLLHLSSKLELANAAISRNKFRLVDLERRLALIVAELRKSADREGVQTEHYRQVEALTSDLSDLSYVGFEDIYRGSRDDIKSRQSIYIPRIEATFEQLQVALPVLDLGCGRGEWLELLTEHRLACQGVDANSVMVQICEEFGLPVSQADGIEFLANCKPRSYAVVTGFHIIEHLSLQAQLRLVDEALRVLEPGGLLILETPNPANLVVGSSTFYLDPTHVKPIPSEQLRFLLEARGFIKAETLLLHPADAPIELEGSAIGTIVKQRLFGPQDYAVIAKKP